MEQSTRLLSDIIVYSKYAKFRPDLNRRENWGELITRRMEMDLRKFPKLEAQIRQAYQYVFDKKVLTSARGLQFAGKPIEINPARQYNCSFIAVDHWRVFGEIMFLLLGGTGAGYSVQRHHVEKLPPVMGPIARKRRFLIGDSIEGWAEAVNVLIEAYLFGKSDPVFDLTDIRPKGSALLTAGGKAPGPQPLADCLYNLRKILDSVPRGQQLTPLQVHDLICFISDAVLTGGIRRAALICLYSFDDAEMLHCKTGDWQDKNPQRRLANNSPLILRHRIEEEEFLHLWDLIRDSRCGEPGPFFSNSTEMGTNPCQPTWATVLTPDGIKTIGDLTIGSIIWSGKRWTYVTKKWSTGINFVHAYRTEAGTFYGTKEHRVVSRGEKIEVRYAKTIDVSPRTPWTAFEESDNKKSSPILADEFFSKEETFDLTVSDPEHTYWTDGLLVSNCAEIGLRATGGLCNLTTINVGDVVTQEELNNRAIAASFLGTLQASYTDFHFLRETWRKTAERDALLGVSMTGIASGAVTKLNLIEAAKQVISENKRIAGLIGINEAARTTCVKPEGTLSLVLGTSSGIHGWYSDFYIRRIILQKDEPIYYYFLENAPELLEDNLYKPHIQSMLSLPIRAPSGAVLGSEDALDFLERVKFVYTNWVKRGHRRGDNTHNVSATVYVKDHEWEDVGRWMWENRNYYNGITTLPYDGHVYKQAPMEAISEEKFVEMNKYIESKKLDLRDVSEIEDLTTRQQEQACMAGSCELQY